MRKRPQPTFLNCAKEFSTTRCQLKKPRTRGPSDGTRKLAKRTATEQVTATGLGRRRNGRKWCNAKFRYGGETQIDDGERWLR